MTVTEKPSLLPDPSVPWVDKEGRPTPEFVRWCQSVDRVVREMERRVAKIEAESSGAP